MSLNDKDDDDILGNTNGLTSGLHDLLMLTAGGGGGLNKCITISDKTARGGNGDGVTSLQCEELMSEEDEVCGTAKPTKNTSNHNHSKTNSSSSATTGSYADATAADSATNILLEEYYANASPRKKEIRANYKSNIHKINKHFDLPIRYSYNRHDVNAKMIKDLELNDSQDVEDIRGLYERVMHPSSQFGKTIVNEFASFYTTDEIFLKQNQQLLEEMGKQNIQSSGSAPLHDCMIQLWDDIKNDTDFNYTYSYIDWETFNFLNQNEWFLLFMTWYSLSAPILSLLTPVLLLIMPFFVMQTEGSILSVQKYVEILMVMLEDNAVGRLMTSSFRTSSLQDKFSMMMSAAFYCFSIYQNFLMCEKFYKNMKVIHANIGVITEYLVATERDMQFFLSISGKLSRFDEFNKDVKWHLETLQKLRSDLQKITPYIFSYKKVMEMGYVLRSFYNIYNDDDLNESFLFSFGFSGYYECMRGLAARLRDGKMNKMQFVKCVDVQTDGDDDDDDDDHDSKDDKDDKDDKDGRDEKVSSKGKKRKAKRANPTTKLQGAFYPGLIDKNEIVLNDITMKTNMIVTGPNASGKTTILKSTLVNILFAQQFGIGCFSEATLAPYDHFHCYVNIPDTSGRDSLFQSESRQCSDILKNIKTNTTNDNGAPSRHFCAFDELYSGTNPEEAELCGYAFLLYLNKQKQRVDFVLTTHYGNLCRRLDALKTITNYRMKVETVVQVEGNRYGDEDEDEDEDEDGDRNHDESTGGDALAENTYTYQMELGINEKNGGIVILQQMEYPKEVMRTLQSEKEKSKSVDSSQ